MTIHPRNQQYKDHVLEAPYEICIERARYFTESYRETEGEHPATRASKALEHTLENVSVYILDEEQVVGNRSSKLVGAVIPVERGDINTVLEMELDFLKTRERQPFHIDPVDERELKDEILPYWHGRTVRDRKKALWKANGLYFRPALGPLSWWRRWRSLDLRRLAETVRAPKTTLTYARRGLREILHNNPALAMNVFDVQGHLILGHRNVLREGFAGIEASAGKRLEQARRDKDPEGRAFLEGVIRSCGAVRDFAARFANEAERLAANGTSPQRREELLAIAARCRHVPYHPPRDFREAVQALWLTQTAAMIAHGMAGILAVGRPDQYLYPFYARDKTEGRIGEGDARALMEELLIKLSYNLLVLPYVGKRTSSELGGDSCSPTVGGLTPEGEDGANELSGLILDAFTNVKSLGNSFAIRFSGKSQSGFWRKALDTYRHTSGAALFYDDVVVEALKKSGTAEEDARDYGVIGCVEPTSGGNTFGCTSGNDISLVAALEMALLNGRLRIMGRRIGPRTGDPRRMASFEEFLEAFKTQVAFLVDAVAKAVNLKDEIYREAFPNPLISATLSGCVQKARDMTSGGAQYNFGSISGRGFGTAVDSLAAIKHCVYDERSLSMGQLLRALDRNFRGEEALRMRLAAKAPKYGCDNPLADAIACDVSAHFCREVARHGTTRGGPFRPSFFSYGMHVFEGLVMGATPNGRLAGEPVSNSFSPSNGAETKGPTALLQSAAKIDHTLISNGCAVNVKLMPNMFQGNERLDKIAALVRAFFEMGGMEVQFNVVSNETLRDAQRHPDKHRDLVVRVSGYSALFTDLGEPLQNEIIQRTEFGRL